MTFKTQITSMLISTQSLECLNRETLYVQIWEGLVQICPLI